MHILFTMLWHSEGCQVQIEADKNTVYVRVTSFTLVNAQIYSGKKPVLIYITLFVWFLHNSYHLYIPYSQYPDILGPLFNAENGKNMFSDTFPHTLTWVWPKHFSKLWPLFMVLIKVTRTIVPCHTKALDMQFSKHPLL